jgi:hypothetical protein
VSDLTIVLDHQDAQEARTYARDLGVAADRMVRSHQKRMWRRCRESQELSGTARRCPASSEMKAPIAGNFTSDAPARPRRGGEGLWVRKNERSGLLWPAGPGPLVCARSTSCQAVYPLSLRSQRSLWEGADAPWSSGAQSFVLWAPRRLQRIGADLIPSGGRAVAASSSARQPQRPQLARELAATTCGAASGDSGGIGGGRPAF